MIRKIWRSKRFPAFPVGYGGGPAYHLGHLPIMTTRNYPPVLDRKITRIILGEPTYDPWGALVPADEEDATLVKVWAARRDFRASDFVESGFVGLITIFDSRFIVRALGPAWATGDAFLDDEGLRRTV